MKKWIGLLVSLLLIVGMVSAFLFSTTAKEEMTVRTRSEGYRILRVQEEEKKEQSDPHMIQILKEIQSTLDEWLKSLNRRIESEDVTRFEVRFLEILRSILEWMKEKVDARIESSEQERPQKKEKKERGMFRETRQDVVSFSKKG